MASSCKAQPGRLELLRGFCPLLGVLSRQETALLDLAPGWARSARSFHGPKIMNQPWKKEAPAQDWAAFAELQRKGMEACRGECKHKGNLALLILHVPLEVSTAAAPEIHVNPRAGAAVV